VGERRVTVAREGQASYLKVAHHAPAFADAGFCPLLVLDAVLTGAKGVNLWASFRNGAPQRSARLYQALVNTGLASSVSGALMPTQDPFLYTISATANDGTPLAALEAALVAELDRVRATGITADELRNAKTQLRARSVFENDSISNIGHQLGFFATIGSWRDWAAIGARLDAVTVEDVAAAAERLVPEARTVGWFDPSAVAAGAS
jgi:zinc protease